MASFTDQTSQFNPYISQNPVQAMVQVGMQKQAQYDQGVQKIQGYLDNIAGIDLVKDSHKAMLQSKLDELGNRLKVVAAGDFSNQQLVNSVGGMATQIIKDKDVQNAMYSTQMYKRQMQRAEEDSKKSGGSNVYNRNEFLKQTQGWLNDGSATSPYNIQYDDYRDVYKKLVEIGKTVGIDSKTTQNLFQTDDNGRPILVDGKLQYNDVMVETLLKGKDKNKLLSAFRAGLDAGDYKQLAINGKYELQSKTPQELIGMLDNTFNSYQKDTLLQKQTMQDKLLELKCKVFSPKEQPYVDAEIDRLEEGLVMLDDNLTKRKRSTDQLKLADPDAIRSSIYTDNYLDSVSNALSEKETAEKKTKNPAVEVMFERERIQIAKSAEARQLAEFRYKQNYDASKMAFDKWKELFNAGLVDENGRPTGGSLYASGKRDIPLSDVTDPIYFTSKFEEGLNDDLNKKQGLYEKVAIAHWKARNADKNLDETQIKTAINSYAKKLGMSYNDYIILQGSKAVDAVNGDKNSAFGPELNPTIKEINALDKTITIKLALQKQAEKDISEKAKTQGFQAFDYNKVKISPVNITLDLPSRIENGKYAGYSKQTLNIPKEDLYKFARISDVGGIKSKAESEEIATIQKSLNKKYGEVQARAIYQNLVGVNRLPGQAKLIEPMLTAIQNENFKRTQKLREEYYKGISSVSVPQTQILYKGKPEQEKKLVSNIASIVSDYAAIGGYDEFSKYASDPKSEFQVNINPAASANGQNSYTLQMTKPDGTIVEKPIMERHYEFLTGQKAPRVAESNMKAIINGFGTGSTNSGHHYTDKDAYTTAYYKADDFANTSKYQVAADFAEGANGKYFPKFYINTGSGYRFYNYNPTGRGFDGFTLEEAEAFPQTVDDVFISALLRRQ